MEKIEKMNCFLNKDDDVLLPGFRFHPTDEELVGFYLRRKVEKKPLCIELIRQIDVYKFDPWDLPINSVGDKEMYFFCIRERKYKNSIRPNRVTGSGFWKATGIDRPIYSVTSTDCIGLKKSLVYYRGSAGKGTKTDWMMHEFRLPVNGMNPSFSLVAPKNPTQEAEIWTLCRIFKRNSSYRKYTPGWREASSMKQDQYDTSPQRCSLESDNSGNICFGPPDDGKVEMVSRQLGPISLTPFPATYTASDISFNNIEFTKDGNWGDLGSIVDFASDPSFMYECK